MNYDERYFEKMEANRKTEDKFYNRFTDFIEEHNISDGSKVFYHKILCNLHKFEVVKNEYLYNFNEYEIREILSNIGTKSQSVVQSTYYIISSYCNWAFNRGYLYTVNPCLNIDVADFLNVKRAKTMYCSLEEFENELSNCKYGCGFFDKFVLVLARNGVTVESIAELKWFNIQDDYIKIDTTDDKHYKLKINDITRKFLNEYNTINSEFIEYGNKGDKEVIYNDIGLLIKSGTIATNRDFIKERDLTSICRRINKYNNTNFKLSELILSYRIDQFLQHIIYIDGEKKIDYEKAIEEYNNFYGNFDYSTYNIFKNKFQNITGIKIQKGSTLLGSNK